MADPSAAARKMFAKMGIAMPDGSFYIRNGSVGASDLDNAIHAVGRGEQGGTSGNSIRLHIIKRAAALKLSSKIPDTWNSDGSLKHSAFDQEIEAFLEHFGVPGMKWGHRKDGSKGSSHQVSDDAARASITKATIEKHGPSAVSNIELQHLVSRMNLEQQHGKLNPEHVSTGKKILKELVGVGGNVAKQQATSYANQYAAKGIEALIKKGSK